MGQHQEKNPGPNDILHIRVHKARNLENKEIIGKSDPFISIKFGSEVDKSKTINNNLNPEWEFHTRYHIGEASPKMIEVKILDEDIGKDQVMGEVTLDIEHLKSKGQVLQKWIPLTGCKSGEIMVSTQYVKAGEQKTRGIENEK